MDEIELRNENGRALLSPAAGASLRSLRVRIGSKCHELLAGGGAPFDPRALPAGTGSFLMAPWVNRIREGRLVAPDGEHLLPSNWGEHSIHGTVRDQPWDVLEVGTAHTELETRLASPWPYRGSVRYRAELSGASLLQTLEIRAARGEREFPAALGWHPWFARSLGSGDLSVRADVRAQWELDSTLLPTGGIATTALTDKLSAGGHFAANEVDGCFLLHHRGAIVVTWPELALQIENTPEVTHLMLFSPSHAVCIEPMTSAVNAAQLSAQGRPDTGSRMVRPGQPLVAATRWSWSGR